MKNLTDFWDEVSFELLECLTKCMRQHETNILAKHLQGITSVRDIVQFTFIHFP